MFFKIKFPIIIWKAPEGQWVVNSKHLRGIFHNWEIYLSLRESKWNVNSKIHK